MAIFCIFKMNLVAYIKNIITGCLGILVFCGSVSADNITPGTLPTTRAIIAVFDTLPRPQKVKTEVQKPKPGNRGKGQNKIKDVPRARPQQKPKVVGPKMKPVKIIKPKVGPKR